MIKITKHALTQYKSRILNNQEADDTSALQQIEQLFDEAKYVSDNSKGILFRNYTYMIEFIVKSGRIVTLFPIIRKERKHERNLKIA